MPSREQRFVQFRHELQSYLRWAATNELLKPLELKSFSVEVGFLHALHPCVRIKFKEGMHYEHVP